MSEAEVGARETPNLDRIAGKVAKELHGAGFGFDPTIIIAIITAIIKLFGGCNLSARQVEERTSRPRLLDKLKLNRLIRQNYSGDHEALEAALLDAGQDLTAQDAQLLYDETT